MERHLAECPACAELARDSAAAVAFMERAADVEPPPELITRILFDAPWSKEKAGRKSAQAGWPRILSPILQPRFAMGDGDDHSFAVDAGPVRGVRCGSCEVATWSRRQVWAGIEDRVDTPGGAR